MSKEKIGSREIELSPLGGEEMEGQEKSGNEGSSEDVLGAGADSEPGPQALCAADSDRSVLWPKPGSESGRAAVLRAGAHLGETGANVSFSIISFCNLNTGAGGLV